MTRCIEKMKYGRRRILQSIEEISPGKISLLSPKSEVERGFYLYRSGCVYGFKWSSDLACLTAVVQDASKHAVNISLKNSGLVFSCSCPDNSASEHCRHVVSVLATIKNLIRPNIFNVPNLRMAQRTALERDLFGEIIASLRPQTLKGREDIIIVLEKINNRVHVSVSKAGELGRINPLFLPSELYEFAVNLPPYLEHLKFYKLKKLLTDHADKYPLLVRSSGNEWDAHFDASPAYYSGIRFDVRHETVGISEVWLRNGVEIKDAIVFGDMVFEPDSGGIGLISDRAVDRFFDSIRMGLMRRGVERRSCPFEVRVDFFQGIELMRDFSTRTPGRDTMIFSESGRDVEPRKVSFDYRLRIEPSAESDAVYIMRPECLLDGAAYAPSYNLFRFLNEINYLPGPLRAKKRINIIIRASMNVIAAKSLTAAEKVIKAAAIEADFSKRKYRTAFTQFLRGVFYAWHNQERIMLHNNSWVSARIEPDQSLLYRIPFELFGGGIFSSGMGHAVMAIDREVLLAHLPVLTERLEGSGIKVVFKGKPVRRARLDIEINVTAGAGIDWFELKPQIRCENMPLSSIALDSGFVEKDECIEVIAPDSLALLRDIRALALPKPSGKRPEEVVRIPRLCIFDWLSLRSRGAILRLPKEDELCIERLLNFQRIERNPLPQGLVAELRPYQHRGYDWLAFLYEHRFGACLADDMGLGKTLQAICLIAGIREGILSSPVRRESRPHLIVVPPSLLFNWEAEFKRFYPDLRVRTYAGTGRSLEHGRFDVVLTTYGTVRQDIDRLSKIAFDVITFDEAQTIKNIEAATTSAARRLNAYFKLAMTGTPLENHLGEYYSVIDLALPGLLGGYEKFRSSVKSGDTASIELLIRRTRPFVLRRTKEMVLKELPKKTEIDVYLDLTDEQKALYTRTVEEVRRTIEVAYKEKTAAQAKVIVLSAILKLRQICLSPRLLSCEFSAAFPKAEFLIEKLHELLEEGHSALVFSQFTSFLNLLEPRLKAAGIEYSRLDGSTPVGRRKKIVKEFQSGDAPPVFLLSLKAGGKGLNLTRASYVFHLDPWWNPAVEDQATDRAHRIGQRQSITVTRILMRHTIEEKMMALKQKKQALYRAVMEGAEAAGSGAGITKEDFEFLIS